MTGLEDHYRQSDSKEDFADRYLTYMGDLLGQVDRPAVARILEAFLAAHQAGRTIYFLANGGSAAVASHFVNDIGIGTRAEGERPFRAVSLVDNIPTLTAVGNDEGYDKIFVRPLEAMLEPDDVVVAMSVSGNSPNVIEAVQFSRQVGALVIGCTGKPVASVCHGVEILTAADCIKGRTVTTVAYEEYGKQAMSSTPIQASCAKNLNVLRTSDHVSPGRPKMKLTLISTPALRAELIDSNMRSTLQRFLIRSSSSGEPDSGA